LNDTTAAEGVVLDVFDHCRSAPTPDECPLPDSDTRKDARHGSSSPGCAI
jgi:hypothetical protein